MNRFYDAALSGEITQPDELSAPIEEDPFAILAEQAISHPAILEELPSSVLEKILAYFEEENQKKRERIAKKEAQLKLSKKNVGQE